MNDTKEPIYTAAIIIIGNEILSARTQDTNLNYLAAGLNARGIRLGEARVIPDRPNMIISTVNELRRRYDYVFTTGGIGPTHDDITAKSIARAFGTRLQCDEEALRILQEYYGDELNDARKRMAYIPEQATLLDNPMSRAPGFQLANVYVLPGVPRIMQAMFEGFSHRLAGGHPLLSHTVSALIPESQTAEGLAAIQARYPQTELGSYPYVRNRQFGTAFVIRSEDESVIENAVEELVALVRSFGMEPHIEKG
ncbi:MAG: competence/damage-inducible protein A [Gammaproteobacteria bacterium]|nr:competence/damage-inducible protein A [Gammaproteobacteria bacterium]